MKRTRLAVPPETVAPTARSPSTAFWRCQGILDALRYENLPASGGSEDPVDNAAPKGIPLHLIGSAVGVQADSHIRLSRRAEGEVYRDGGVVHEKRVRAVTVGRKHKRRERGRV